MPQAPSHAIRLWCDKTTIYVEYPSTKGEPVVLPYPRTLGSIQNILALIPEDQHYIYEPPRVVPKAIAAEGLDLRHLDAAMAALEGLLHK